MVINEIEFQIDLGCNHWLRFYRWAPDRDLNPQYDGIPDVEKAGCLVAHLDLKKNDGSYCMSGVGFDTEASLKYDPDRPKWQVQSIEPLTVSPSLLCMQCGDHGFIRNGKWEPA